MSTTPESTSTGLPQNQELAAIALAAGASIAAAAYEAKVTRQQVHKWLHTAPFTAIVQDERAKRVQTFAPASTCSATAPSALWNAFFTTRTSPLLSSSAPR